MVNSPRKLLKKIRHAGAVFLGHYSPVTVGDYIAGPSHVLPTGGSARTFSGLGIDDFIRRTHVITYTKNSWSNQTGKLVQPAEIVAARKQ